MFSSLWNGKWELEKHRNKILYLNTTWSLWITEFWLWQSKHFQIVIAQELLVLANAFCTGVKIVSNHKALVPVVLLLKIHVFNLSKVGFWVLFSIICWCFAYFKIFFHFDLYRHLYLWSTLCLPEFTGVTYLFNEIFLHNFWVGPRTDNRYTKTSRRGAFGWIMYDWSGDTFRIYLLGRVDNGTGGMLRHTSHLSIPLRYWNVICPLGPFWLILTRK